MAQPLANKGKSILIPEVVKRGDVEVGRFEVTRAQFEAFDKKFRSEPGTENYPANGVTFEQATAYTEWLTKLTGQTWRLPTEKEAADWYSKKRWREHAGLLGGLRAESR